MRSNGLVRSAHVDNGRFAHTKGRLMLLSMRISITMMMDEMAYRLKTLKSLNQPSPKRSLTANHQYM